MLAWEQRLRKHRRNMAYFGDKVVDKIQLRSADWHRTAYTVKKEKEKFKRNQVMYEDVFLAYD